MVEKNVIHSDQAPAAIGPYSQAIAVKLAGAQFLYCSGQIPLHPGTGAVVGTTVGEQTTQVMTNIAGLLGTAGATLADVVKTTVYLRDMADFAAMNEVYQAHFGAHKPARSTVAVAGLPRDVRVEIEVHAVY